MRCKECGQAGSRVIESRELEEGGVIRRRRQCLNCSFRFTTYERLEVPNLVVIKKDGRREMFDRDKVAAGVYRACEKRPIPIGLVDSAIRQIEREVQAMAETEVPSRLIGEMVMTKLIELDDVAYVRFASVYRSFKDVASFERELAKLKERALGKNQVS